MTGTEMQRDDDQLEHYFAAARRAAPAPSEELLARILADAADAMPARFPPAAAPGPAPLLRGLLRRHAAPAGWSALGGLVTATVAGLWIGYSGVTGAGSLAASLVGAEVAGGSMELLPDGEPILVLAGWEG